MNGCYKGKDIGLNTNRMQIARDKSPNGRHGNGSPRKRQNDNLNPFQVKPKKEQTETYHRRKNKT